MHRRAGAVPLRHLPDRLHGRRKRRDRAGRHGRRLGLRAGRPVRDQERVDVRRGPRDRHRHACPSASRWREAHGKAETIDFDEGDGLRQAAGDDQGPRAGPLHRLPSAPRRTRTAASTPCSTRSKQDGHARHRPRARPAPGDLLLPQGRHGLRARRLCRLPRQGADGRVREQGPDHEDGPDARAPLSRSR